MAQIVIPFTGGSLDQLLAQRKAFQRAFILSIFPNADSEFLSSLGLGFQFGGVVPGPRGKPQLAVVHGEEEVLTPGQRRQRALPSPDSSRSIIFQIENFYVNKPSDIAKLERALSTQTGNQVRLTSRSRRFIIGR